jgi:hypothetical protein
MSAFLGMALRPILVFVVLACICLPARFAVIWWLPDGKLKRFLLLDIRAHSNRKPPANRQEERLHKFSRLRRHLLH